MKSLGRAITIPQLVELLQEVIEIHGENITWEGDDSGAMTLLDTDGRRVAVIHSENSD